MAVEQQKKVLRKVNIEREVQMARRKSVTLLESLDASPARPFGRKSMKMKA